MLTKGVPDNNHDKGTVESSLTTFFAKYHSSDKIHVSVKEDKNSIQNHLTSNVKPYPPLINTSHLLI